jgi:hypothetical protein
MSRVNQQLLTAFFEDLARAMDYWADTIARTLDDPPASSPWMEDREPLDRLSAKLDGSTDDLRLVLSEGMRGLLNSVLATLDGATASAEVGRVALTDDQGRVLAEGLHELFVGHLFDTGRLK